MRRWSSVVPVSTMLCLILAACGQPTTTATITAVPANATTAPPVVAEAATVITDAPANVTEVSANPTEATEAAAESTETPTQATVASTVVPDATTSNLGEAADLAGIKVYLQKYGDEYLKAGADQLKANVDQYYEAVKAANFDYQAAWGNGETLRPLIINMRAAFNQSHTGYESVEGIVAGVPSLAAFDTILDAGSSGEDGGDNVADFSLTLPDGTELAQPGNFYHMLLEPMVYGTDKTYMKLMDIDVDGNGSIEFGDALPDANRLKGAADGFVTYVDQTITAINGWEPTPADAFTAMVTMTPTMDEYFGNWKESRYVTGDTSTEVRFVAHSRLVDVSQILGSLRTIYSGVEPLVRSKDPAMAQQIDKNYADLSAFVDGLLQTEATGTHYPPDQAVVLGKQAQDQAQAITGQVTQAAAVLDIKLEAE